VIVGCGFGGLSAAKALRRADVDVTVIDRTNHHLVQPLLHQLATGILSEGDIALPIRDVLRGQRNTRVVLGEVVDVDLDTRRVTVDTIGLRSQIAYDSLIVATGGPVLLRASRIRARCTRDEDARSGTRAPGADFRRIRDG
jgi:NADH:ubiquinone reductase (H+-translocating)